MTIRTCPECHSVQEDAAGQATAAQAVVPAGWKLVPVDATDDMLRAIRNQRSGGRVGAGDRADWTAWLAAAPTPAPVLWLSPEQFANFMDTDEAPFGKYIPARKTSGAVKLNPHDIDMLSFSYFGHNTVASMTHVYRAFAQQIEQAVLKANGVET